MAEPDLQKRLEQLGQRLVDDVETWERSTRDQRRAVVGQLASEVQSALTRAQLTKAQRQALRRQEKAERRAAKRREEDAQATVGGGVVALLFAVALAFYAFLHPELWWLVFVSLGVGTGGARTLSVALDRRRALAPPAPVEAPSPLSAAPVHEVDRLCDQLLADLAQAPEAVKQFIQKPEATIQALRSAARALDARRAQLLAESPRDRLEALQAQRQDLVGRQAASSDDFTRRKLAEAVASLDSQQAALQQLATAGERVDGEYTSLLVSLQELRTRVSIARSAGSSVQVQGLQASVARLNGELEAITEGLDSVARERLQPVAPIAPDVDAATSAGPARDRSR
jgi:hypothetical protein